MCVSVSVCVVSVQYINNVAIKVTPVCVRLFARVCTCMYVCCAYTTLINVAVAVTPVRVCMCILRVHYLHDVAMIDFTPACVFVCEFLFVC